MFTAPAHRITSFLAECVCVKYLKYYYLGAPWGLHTIEIELRAGFENFKVGTSLPNSNSMYIEVRKSIGGLIYIVYPIAVVPEKMILVTCAVKATDKW